MTLTAYMGAKIGIEEYLMNKNTQNSLPTRRLNFKVKGIPKQSAPIDWTYRTC